MSGERHFPLDRLPQALLSGDALMSLIHMWTSIMRHSDPMLRLRANAFRRSFALGELEHLQLQKWGWPVIREHAEKIVRERLMVTDFHGGKPHDGGTHDKTQANDGTQTPYTGHPVFIAQHATATCCRQCLFKWHRIPLFRPLNEEEIRLCVTLILRWIAGQEESRVSFMSGAGSAVGQKALTPSLLPLAAVH